MPEDYTPKTLEELSQQAGVDVTKVQENINKFGSTPEAAIGNVLSMNKKSPVSMLSSDDAINSLNKDKAKLDSITAIPPAEAPKQEEKAEEPAKASEEGGYSFDEMYELLGSDFTGVTKKGDKYYPDSSALERIGITGLQEDKGEEMQSDVDKIGETINNLVEQFNNLNLDNDPTFTTISSNIRNEYDQLRRQMQDEFIALQSEVHKTILFVTHDLDEALKLGDHIAIMKDGEIIQIGTPEEVITAPSDGYVREFVQDASPAKVVTASSIMEEPKVILYEWQSPKVAMHLLRTKRIDEAYLVDRGGKLLGLITMEKLIELFRQGGKSITEAIEPDFIQCTGDTVVEDLFAMAASTGYPIAVVDENGVFQGELYSSTVLVSMVQEKAETNE